MKHKRSEHSVLHPPLTFKQGKYYFFTFVSTLKILKLRHCHQNQYELGKTFVIVMNTLKALASI